MQSVNNASVEFLYFIAMLSTNGIIEDRLFEQASIGFGEGVKMLQPRSVSSHLLEIFAYFSIPLVIIPGLLHLCPWTPHFEGCARRFLYTYIPLGPGLLLIIPHLLSSFASSKIPGGRVLGRDGMPHLHDLAIWIGASLSFEWDRISEWLMQEPVLGYYWYQANNSLLVFVAVYAFVMALPIRVPVDDRIRGFLNEVNMSRTTTYHAESAMTELGHLLHQDPLNVGVIYFSAFTFGPIVVILIFFMTGPRTAIANFKSWTSRKSWLLRLPYIKVFCIASSIFVMRYADITAWRPCVRGVKQETALNPTFAGIVRRAAWSPHNLDEMTAILIQYGLLHRNSRSGYTIHPLTQWWAQKRIQPDHSLVLVREATRFLSNAYFSSTCRNDPICQQMLIPHLVDIAGKDIQTRKSNFDRLSVLLRMLYESLSMSGRA